MNDSEMIALRAAMHAEGWGSEDRISNWGTRSTPAGYSIWFSRWDWHGRRTDNITFHAHVADVLRAPEAVAHAAELARQAWATFGINQCPRQSPDGRGVEEWTWMSALWAKFDAEGEAPSQDVVDAMHAARERWRERDEYDRLRAKFGDTPRE